MTIKLEIKNLIAKYDIIARKASTSWLVGNYKSAYKGRGLEFEDFREYRPEDDASTICWKASLRTNTLLVKEYREERNLKVYFLIDVSNSMLFGSTEKLKNQYAAEIVASMAYTSSRIDDAVGYAMFNDKIVKCLKPLTGEKQYYHLLNSLTDEKIYGGGYDLESALKLTLGFLEADTILFIVSDFIGLKGDWERWLKMACSKFDVIALMVRDPRDKELPDASKQVVIRSPFTEEKMAIEPKKIREEYAAYVKKQEEQLENTFKRAGAEFLSLTTDKDFTGPLIGMFKRRESKFHY